MKSEEEIKERFKDLLDLRFDQLECGPGWGDIIWEALEKIEACPTYKDIKESHGFTIPIIKEKFGSLRIQYFGATEEINLIVDQAEQKSEKTCEMCGCESVVRKNRGWYSSICNECADKRGNE